MKTRTIFLALAGIGLLSLSLIAFAQAGGQRPTITRNPAGGGADHPSTIPSVAAPEGWKPCPRCQNANDRAKANADYKIAGHPNNPKDLSGVWGFNGIGNAFAKAPPMTEWGKQQFAKTIGDKLSLIHI